MGTADKAMIGKHGFACKNYNGKHTDPKSSVGIFKWEPSKDKTHAIKGTNLKRVFAYGESRETVFKAANIICRALDKGLEWPLRNVASSAFVVVTMDRLIRVKRKRWKKEEKSGQKIRPSKLEKRLIDSLDCYSPYRRNK